MKFLSPSEYLVWPSFAQRICFVYNAVPHDSIASVSPFEMDFSSSPVSAFAPPDPDPDDVPSDALFDDSRQQLPPTKRLSPAVAAATIQTSVAAFHCYARTHAEYLQTTTAERLSQQVNPTSFQLDHRVKIYMPPTQAQLERTGRHAKHIV
jgi:hypothetical protein